MHGQGREKNAQQVKKKNQPNDNCEKLPAK